MVHFVLDPIGNVRSAARRYGPVSRARFPGFGLMIYVNEPELIKQVFAGDPTVFHAGEATATVLGPAVGPNSLLTLDEQPHMRQRKLLLPPFHGENLHRFQDTTREITDRDIDSWPVASRSPYAGARSDHARRDPARRVRGPQPAPVRARADARRRVRPPREPDRDVPAAPAEPRTRSPWERFKRARAELDEFLYREIAERREVPDLAERDDVLSLLLQATDEQGRPMSDQELRDELVTVIGAGHETTATALAWAFERLLRNPPVLERLRRSLPEGDAYLDATIKETLRARPVILDVARRLTREIELGGYRIPAGSLLVPSIAATHYREDLYPSPDEFRPERFLDKPPDGYTWLPFGGGVRRCIGASFAQFEMRVILRAILERADLRADRPAPERARLRNITVAPARGCRVALVRPPAPPRERVSEAAGSSADLSSSRTASAR